MQATCLARLGSRASIIFDPHRNEIHYGNLGLMCQAPASLVVALDDGETCQALPFSTEGSRFHIVEQRQTMTGLFFTAHSVALGVRLEASLIAPFWPQDRETSTVPAYIFQYKLSPIKAARWTRVATDYQRRGTLRFGIRLPGATVQDEAAQVRLTYPVSTGEIIKTGEGGLDLDFSPQARAVQVGGEATDLVAGLDGAWRSANGLLEIDYSFDKLSDAPQTGSAVIASYCADALLERFGKPMAMLYTSFWQDVDGVVDYVREAAGQLLAKSAKFDDLWTGSSFPLAVQDLSALSFQSYLMNTLWAVGEDSAEWFSVWEGSCWYNSTVDVTYNEAMFYFACWPELLEIIFEEWSVHANDVAAERERVQSRSLNEREETPVEEAFPGKILEHDMGAGWTVNGMSYHHMMPVEENANWLLMLYAHGKWWGRTELFERYNAFNKDLVEYLLWTDSTGNGFPDRGVANTIDDATPAVQYGRDNVYLGVKRLGALHAAARMFAACGETEWAQKCEVVVEQAVSTLNDGWLGDHWGVCLDKSAAGLTDCWTGEPLPYDELPGWDAYSLYTTNGLLYLLMIDDLPDGIDRGRLRTDVVNACRESMTHYGCGHSSLDVENMWVAMNLWRDCAAGYLGVDMLENCERYWAQQAFANGPGAEKPNCFTETSLTNNLVWYPRGAAIFGLALSTNRLVIDRTADLCKSDPIKEGTWPLLPLIDWQREGAAIGEPCCS